MYNFSDVLVFKVTQVEISLKHPYVHNHSMTSGVLAYNPGFSKAYCN